MPPSSIEKISDQCAIWHDEHWSIEEMSKYQDDCIFVFVDNEEHRDARGVISPRFLVNTFGLPLYGLHEDFSIQHWSDNFFDRNILILHQALKDLEKMYLNFQQSSKNPDHVYLLIFPPDLGKGVLDGLQHHAPCTYTMFTELFMNFLFRLQNHRPLQNHNYQLKHQQQQQRALKNKL